MTGSLKVLIVGNSETNAELAVYLASGYNEKQATEPFAGKGLAGFIQRPDRPHELIAPVRQVMGGTS